MRATGRSMGTSCSSTVDHVRCSPIINRFARWIVVVHAVRRAIIYSKRDRSNQEGEGRTHPSLEPRRRGVRSVGIALGSTSLLLCILPYIYILRSRRRGETRGHLPERPCTVVQRQHLLDRGKVLEETLELRQKKAIRKRHDE